VKEITLKKDVRCFERAFDAPCPLLVYIHQYLPDGDEVNVGDPVTMSYDHRDILAVPYEWMGITGFLLYEEVKSSIEPTKLIRIK
jgi:hypothetical protein